MSENLEFFRDTVSRILDDTIGTTEIEAAEERAFPERLFGALRDNGISMMLAAEAQGGIDATLEEAVAIMRAAGTAAAPGPLLETLLGHALLGQAGVVANGAPLSLVLLPEGLPAGNGSVVYDVPWSESVDYILLVAPQHQGVRMIRTPRSVWQTTRGADAAGEPRNTLRSEADALGDMFDLTISFNEVLRQASLLRAGQSLGALEWTFRRSVEYAMERQQFGREIGKFQAVQQTLAEFADHVLASTVIVEAAAVNDSLVSAAAARSRLADATDAAISISHQVHGAIGFSREYPLNQRTKRLMAWRDDYGSIPFWRHTLGNQFLANSRESLWPALTDTGSKSAT